MSENVVVLSDPAAAARVRRLAAARGVPAADALAAAANLGGGLLALEQTIRDRRAADPEHSYAARLLHGPEDSLLKKLCEEAAEAALAAKAGDAAALARETADLWFHSIVALTRFHSGLGAVADILAARAGTSGLAEKAARRSTN